MDRGRFDQVKAHTKVESYSFNLVKKYKEQGYTEQEIAQAVSELQQEEQQEKQQTQDSQNSILQQSYVKAMQQQQNDVRNYASQTLVSGGTQDNLIKWQLELDSILERIEHMLKGDKPRFVQGNLIFVPSASNEDRIFTDFGVGEVMRILSMYLNRNTILSNYDEPTINVKVFDFGIELSDLIFLKYEMMFATLSMDDCFKKVFSTALNLVPIEKNGELGIDGWAVQMKDSNGMSFLQELTSEQMLKVVREFNLQKLEKRKLYSMIVRQLVDTVHSAYLRALNGGERQSLHEQRSVNQNETIVPQGMGYAMGGQPVMKQRSALNPLRWIAGKYK